MPANKYALFRYRIIDKCLRSKSKLYPSKEDLRQACEEFLYGSNGQRVSDSTIEKDIWAMRNESALNYYAPIKYSQQERGYCYTDAEYSIDEIALSDDDIEAIKFAANTLYQFKDIEVFQQFEFAINKIFDRLKVLSEIKEEPLNKYVQFETVAFVKGSEYLGDILRAIKQRNVIRFDYNSFFKGDKKERSIEPYLLKEYRNRWYVIGYSINRDFYLTYGLDRISDLKITNDTYKARKYFEADKFFKHSIGITAFQEEPVDVVLTLTPVQGNFVKTQPLHQSQKVLTDNDKECRISLHVLLTYELKMQILMMGKEAKVIKPKKLAHEIRDLLAEALKQYD